MFKNIILILVWSMIFCSCSSKKGDKSATEDVEGNQTLQWMGKWHAKWETLPESYPNMSDVSFTMDGKFHFNEDSITIIANGYDGCIFQMDTIEHSQLWTVSNDTLYLMSKTNEISMNYLIKSKRQDTVELLLMEDIYITLIKEQEVL